MPRDASSAALRGIELVDGEIRLGSVRGAIPFRTPELSLGEAGGEASVALVRADGQMAVAGGQGATATGVRAASD